MDRSPVIPLVLAALLAPVSLAAADSIFVRGDANSDGSIDIADPIFILVWDFLGGSGPSCMDAADADDNGAIEVTDSIRILQYLFLEGRRPEVPFPDCGLDPTSDQLDCGSFPSCAGVNLPPEAKFSASARTG